jgi:suppressor of ftsI/bilirubin oxidase
MEIGGAAVLETRAFDPMHFDPPGGPAKPPAEAATAHAMPAPRAGSPPSAGEPWPEGGARRLLTLEVRDKAAWRGALPARLSALAAPPVEGARERAFRLGFAKGRWRINDRVYAPDETPVEVARGATEIWLLRNYHTSMPHAMHLHGFQFRVLERETSPEQVARLAVDDRGRLATDLGAKDTVLVWPGESVRVAIDFRHPFPDAQTYLFHCHNLEHEDAAMMLRVRVG